MTDGAATNGGVSAVRVDTEDLVHFVERGNRYLVGLEGTLDHVLAERSRVGGRMSAATGYLPEPQAAKPVVGRAAGAAGTDDPFALLVAHASITNRFVEQIVTEFGGFDATVASRVNGATGTIDDPSVIDALDPRTRAALTVARYFPEIFGDDSISGGLQERFAELGSGHDRAGIAARLRDRGLTGQALTDALADIRAAGRFYGRPANADELRALDDANDSNTDGDQKLRATDAWLRTVALTDPAEIAERVSPDPATGPVHQSAIDAVRRYAITAWVVDQDLRARDLQRAFDGDTRIGPLTAVDRRTLIEGFVGSKVAATLDGVAIRNDGLIDVYRANGLADLRSLSDEDLSEELAVGLRAVLAEQAMRLNLVSGEPASAPSSNAAFVAAMLSAEALELAAGDQSAFINELAPERAALFAASLGLNRRFDEFVALDTVEHRATLAGDALEALTDHAGEGGTLTRSGSGFVLMVQSAASIGAYRSFAGPLPFAEQLAAATATATSPGDAAGQVFHRERLTEVFRSPEAVALLASDPVDIDLGTRSRLLHTLIHGFRTVDGDARFWSATDFRDGAVRVSADLVIEHARTYHEVADGRRLPPAAEAALRRLVETDQFQDLVGLNDRSTVSLRSQFVAMAIEEGWSAEDFDRDGDGWEHPAVNGAYLVWLAERTSPPLDPVDRANLRAIGSSTAGQAHLGLNGDVTDGEREAYIRHILDRGWTVETFEAYDPIHNDVINNAFAADAFARYGPDTDIGRALAALDRTRDGYTEAYVRTALGLADGGGDDLIERIVDEIGSRDGSAPLQMIPIHLRTGDRHLDLLLFETVRNGERIVVDLNGKHYRDPDDWYRHNELPPGRVTYPGIRGETADRSVFVAPGSGDHYNLVHRVTENYPDTFNEKYLDWVITGAVIVGGVLMLVGSGGLAVPVVGAGGASLLGSTLVGSVAAYELASGANQLHDHIGHGGDWDDPLAVDAYFTLGEGFLTAVSVGSYGLARRGVPLSSGLAATLTYSNRASEVLEVGLNLQQALQIIESDLSSAEKRRQLAVLGVLGAAEYGIPFVANRMIADNRARLGVGDSVGDGVGATDTELWVAISNGTTSINALRTGLGSGRGTTAEVFTLGPIPDGPAQRPFLLDPNNWTPDRRRLHDELIDNAVQEALQFDAAVGGQPTIYAMRGNTAAGKTRAIPGNIPALEHAAAQTAHLPHRAVNPDNFKVDLRAADPDLPLTSTQVHLESSILAERLRSELAALRRPDGQPISFLVDQRLATLDSVESLLQLATETDRRLAVYDVDAPLEVSLVGVLSRTPGGRDPIPSFSVVAENGFVPIRNERQAVIELLRAHPETASYALYGTRPDGSKALISQIGGGEPLQVGHAPSGSFTEDPSHEAQRLRKTVITPALIDRFVSDLPADYAAEVWRSVEPYIGYTWYDALAHHGAKPPELD
ncbi:MAG: hypothetical protein AAF531_17260 [Actinomycetota bacterium]